LQAHILAWSFAKAGSREVIPDDSLYLNIVLPLLSELWFLQETINNSIKIVIKICRMVDNFNSKILNFGKLF
jgi:hypothetical protein